MKNFLFALTLITSMSTFAEEITPDIDDVLNDEILMPEKGQEDTRADLIKSLTARLKGFLKGGDTELIRTREEIIKILTEDEADVYCEEYFEGAFFWWSCEEDLAGHNYNKTILDYAKQVSKRNQVLARAMLMIAKDKHIDSVAFKYFTTLITIANLPKLVQLMVDRDFNHDWLGMCQSRQGLYNLMNPIMAARRLNQGGILQCINTISNKAPGSYRQQLSLWRCSKKSSLIPRVDCLTNTFRKYSKKE